MIRAYILHSHIAYPNVIVTPNGKSNRGGDDCGVLGGYFDVIYHRIRLVFVPNPSEIEITCVVWAARKGPALRSENRGSESLKHMVPHKAFRELVCGRHI